MKNSTLCLLSALGGAVVGATVAMLITPQSGKELRVKIHNAFDETASRVRDELCRRNNSNEPANQ
mgnify:CR=1